MIDVLQGKRRKKQQQYTLTISKIQTSSIVRQTKHRDFLFIDRFFIFIHVDTRRFAIDIICS